LRRISWRRAYRSRAFGLPEFAEHPSDKCPVEFPQGRFEAGGTVCIGLPALCPVPKSGDGREHEWR
jgi:hypothetical protein